MQALRRGAGPRQIGVDRDRSLEAGKREVRFTLTDGDLTQSAERAEVARLQ